MTITTINSHPVAGLTEIGDNKNGQPNGQDVTDLIFASLIQGVIQHKTGVLRYGEQLNLESRTAGNEATVPPDRASDNVSAGADSNNDNSQSTDTGSSPDRPDDYRPRSGSEHVNGTSTAPIAENHGLGAPDDTAATSAAKTDNGAATDTAEVAIAEQGNVFATDFIAQGAAASTNANLGSTAGPVSNAPNTVSVPGAQVVAGNEASGELVKPIVQNLPTATGNGNNANGQGNSQLPANITVASASAPLVSQPVSNLSSNASLVAQSVSSAAADVTAEEAIVLSESAGNGSRTGSGSGQTGNQAATNGTNGGGQAQTNLAANQGAGVAGENGQPTAAFSTTQAAAARAAAGSQPTQPTGPNSISGSAGQSDFGAQVVRATQLAPPSPPTPPAAPRAVTTQIAVQIQKAVGQGADQISIKLNPPELGRVDVKLEITSQGRVVAQISAEKPETLEMLQRDARGLQQALEDAGLKTDTGSLSFNLRGDGSVFNRELADQSATGNGEPGDDEAADPNGDGGDADAAPQEYASDKLINVEV